MCAVSLLAIPPSFQSRSKAPLNSDLVNIAVEPLPPHAVLQSLWLSLEQRADPSFFTSWGWIGTWLESLPASIHPKLLRLSYGTEIVGLAVLVERKHLRYRLMPVGETHLNATGIRYFDAIMIEYNDFLLDESLAPGFRSLLLQKLLANRTIEEFHASGVSIAKFTLDPPPTGFDVSTITRESRGIDLEQVREAGDYLSLLSSNSRSKIRKAIRECERSSGNLHLKFARDLVQAESMYGDLCRLHTLTWSTRGQAGAFSNAYLHEFHRNLIRNRLQHGEIQLIAAYSGDKLLGVLYNFVYRGRIYNYQSGLDYTLGEKHFKPGLLIHTLAIEHNAKSGYYYYDLMAGDSQYKRTLSTRTGALHWIIYKPQHWKFRIEHSMRLLKQRVSSHLRRTSVTD